MSSYADDDDDDDEVGANNDTYISLLFYEFIVKWGVNQITETAPNIKQYASDNKNPQTRLSVSYVR